MMRQCLLHVKCFIQLLPECVNDHAGLSFSIHREIYGIIFQKLRRNGGWLVKTRVRLSEN